MSYDFTGRRRVHEIIERAAELTGIRAFEIVGPSRARDTSYVRFGVMHVAHKQTMQSLPMIGRTLGGRDHTTIINGLRRAAELIERNPEFARFCKDLEAA